MDDRIQYCIDAELRFARAKFPGSNLNFPALVEEVGELSKALLENSSGKVEPKDVFAEAIQVAVMAIRVAEEGSAEFPYQFDHSHYQAFDVNKPRHQKKQTDFADLIAEALKAADKSKSQISAEFLRRSNSAGCQCGKQKLEGKPLCGICYSSLPNDLKSALRQHRGGELEQIYNLAVKTIEDSRRERRSRR